MNSLNEDIVTCSICSIQFLSCNEGVHGYIGIIEFAFCQECLGGVQDMVENNHICPEGGYFEGGIEDVDDL